MTANELSLGDHVVLASGRTGRIGAISLSSQEIIVRMNEEHAKHNSTGWIPVEAVQSKITKDASP
jgi:preprotein translocase subunit YajC